MGQYTNKGLYNKYDKKNKEREALDYYATPTNEVINILQTLNIDFNDNIILEPCVGGGHMANGIEYYLNQKEYKCKLLGTDIKDRGYTNPLWQLEYGKDFFVDDYEPSTADWIIMNPPYSVIEPFCIRALEIADKGVIMLARLQFLEGEGRYDNILKENPPSDVYIYVDRVQCWKDGIKPTGTSAQAYAWFIFDKSKTKEHGTQIHWIRRYDKVNGQNT